MHGFGFHAEQIYEQGVFQTPAAPPYPILPHVTPVIKIHVYIIICICCVDDNTHVKK
jgi:hypothetical protein